VARMAGWFDVEQRDKGEANKGHDRGGAHEREGKLFSRGGLYCLLSNSVYIGEIRHKQERNPGQHEGIVSRALWERVQERLRHGAARRGEGSKTQAPQSPASLEGY
jgi:hypothetical protein